MCDHTRCFPRPQVHVHDIPAAVPVVLRRDVPAVPVAAHAVARRGGQGAGVRAADHVPSAGVGAAGARSAVRPRGGDTRGVRAAAHHVPAVRVPRTPGQVLLRHVRVAHPPGQVLVAGEQGRQSAGVGHVPHARLDRHVPGRLSVRRAHGIRNDNNNDKITMLLYTYTRPYLWVWVCGGGFEPPREFSSCIMLWLR